MAGRAKYSRAYAERYTGGNDTIDRLHDGKSEIWIVNGIKGRKILLLERGTREEEAKKVYDDRYGFFYYDKEEEQDVA